MFLEVMGKDHWEFDIKVGQSRVKVPFQVILLAILGVLSLGLLKAARQL
jgi:hypothetical protein